jgi:hypothetical protein
VACGNILMRRTPKGAAHNRAHGMEKRPRKQLIAAAALRGGSALIWFLQ